MARSDAYKGPSENPTKKYLSWASNEKSFKYWDKESESEKSLAPPFKFIHLDELATIKGWYEPVKNQGSSMYSNEVRSTKNDVLNVRSKKAGEIIKGLYQDIKLKLVALGGHYHASIYVFSNGEIINISLKGSALAAWSAFLKTNRKSLLGSYVEITGSLDEKNGSIKYSVPVFKLGGPIELSVNEKAEEAYESLQSYFKSRTEAQAAEAEHPAEEIEHPAVPEFAPNPPLAMEDNPLPF